jgi:O-antigen/teichoic acid export membrane protein
VAPDQGGHRGQVRGAGAVGGTLNYRHLISNLTIAVLAQGVSMIISLLTSLVAPKFLGVTEYGYWQLFIFYSGYVGLFLFGLNDGYYLVHGGETREAIDKHLYTSELFFSLISQILISLLLLVGLNFFHFEYDRTFVIACVAIYLIFNNLSGFIGYAFQAMNETKLFSYATVLEKLVFCVPLVVLLILGCGDFRPYVLAYIIGKIGNFIYCLYKSRDLIAFGHYSLRDCALVSFSSIRVGIKLTIANIASLLIVGIARFSVDMTWGVEAFGALSISLSIVSFFITFISQASMVLFPALRQTDSAEQKNTFVNLRKVLTLFLPLSYLVGIPVAKLLGMWLPQYQTAMHYLVLLMPMFVYEAKMDLNCTTFLKVLREEDKLLRINIAVVVLSAVATFININFLASLDAISIGITLCVIARNVIAEHVVSKSFQVPFLDRLEKWGLLLTVLYLLFVCWLGDLLSIICIGILLAIYYFMFRDEIARVAHSFKRVASSR